MDRDMKEIRIEYDTTPLDAMEIIIEILTGLGVEFEQTLTENEEGYIIKYNENSNRNIRVIGEK
jgi:hypothetical protein